MDRPWLIRLKVWWRYRRYKRKSIRSAKELRDHRRQAKAKLASVKAFYEKELAKARLYQVKRDEGWIDAFLQIQKVLPVSYKTAGLDEQIQLPPDLPSEDKPPEYELSQHHQDYVDDVKRTFWESGRAMGQTEGTIKSRWESAGYEMAVEEAMNSVEY